MKVEFKTYLPKQEEIKREWHVIDASGQILGRLASRIAYLLRGKHKPHYTPHLDVGDYVVVLNAAKIRVTGKKMRQKIYYRHSGYPGGLKEIPLERMMAKHPERVIWLAVKGMLPKNTLGRRMLDRLKVYPGETHPHQAQVKGKEPLKIDPAELR